MCVEHYPKCILLKGTDGVTIRLNIHKLKNTCSKTVIEMYTILSTLFNFPAQHKLTLQRVS